MDACTNKWWAESLLQVLCTTVTKYGQTKVSKYQKTLYPLINFWKLIGQKFVLVLQNVIQQANHVIDIK